MKAKPIKITSKLVDDIRLYLTGGMKMKDLRKKHKLTIYVAGLIINKLTKENKLFTEADKIKLQESTTPKHIPKHTPHIAIGSVPSFRIKNFNKYSNEQIADIIHRQLEFEKQVRVTEEVSQKITVPQDWYLKSRLVNTQRIYGTD